VVELVEGQVHGARITVHQLPWSRWNFSKPVDPVRYPFARAVLVGCRVHRVSIRGALIFGRLAGFRTPACEKTFERVQSESVATLMRIPKNLFRCCRGLYGDRHALAGHTLDVRQKGMRGRLLWFNPLRPVRELKTAKIGKGHGGSTQPIRVLGSRVVRSEVPANTMRGRVVGGHVGDTTSERGSSKGTHL
jgi:hypothetical protein